MFIVNRFKKYFWYFAISRHRSTDLHPLEIAQFHFCDHEASPEEFEDQRPSLSVRHEKLLAQMQLIAPFSQAASLGWIEWFALRLCQHRSEQSSPTHALLFLRGRGTDLSGQRRSKTGST